MDGFYIITNKLKDPDFKITNEIRQYIESNGKKCYVSEKDSEGHIIPGTVPEDAGCGLVLGGDGTLIRAVRDLGKNTLPLLGIFLSSFKLKFVHEKIFVPTNIFSVSLRKTPPHALRLSAFSLSLRHF